MGSDQEEGTERRPASQLLTLLIADHLLGEVSDFGGLQPDARTVAFSRSHKEAPSANGRSGSRGGRYKEEEGETRANTMSRSFIALTLLVFVGIAAAEGEVARLPPSSLDLVEPTDVVIRARRQCVAGGCGCGGPCGCGAVGVCGGGCCPAPPPPCVCATPACSCNTNTQLVAVQQTCCTCCRPVCTQACIGGGGCSCGCTRGGCGRKRRSLLAIDAVEMQKRTDSAF